MRSNADTRPGMRVRLRAQALDLGDGGLRMGGGALRQLLDEMAGARLGVGDRAFHGRRVAPHDLVELLGLAGQRCRVSLSSAWRFCSVESMRELAVPARWRR